MSVCLFFASIWNWYNIFILCVLCLVPIVIGSSASGAPVRDLLGCWQLKGNQFSALVPETWWNMFNIFFSSGTPLRTCWHCSYSHRKFGDLVQFDLEPKTSQRNAPICSKCSMPWSVYILQVTGKRPFSSYHLRIGPVMSTAENLSILNLNFMNSDMGSCID